VSSTLEGSVTITVTYDKEESMIQFMVEDTGSGIPIQDQTEIFKMFNSISPSKNTLIKSAGLGLMISKMIVKKFGGTIWFVSKHKHGSSFTFDFHLENSDQL
jgi:signal transduction histidine kinase